MAYRYPKSVVSGESGTQPMRWTPFVVPAIVILALVWTMFAPADNAQSVGFEVAAGWFVLCAVFYLSFHGLKGMAWTSIPVLLTYEALVGFVAFPAWRFFTGQDSIDALYVRTMFVILIGFIPFWLASLLLMDERGIRFTPRTSATSTRVERSCVAMFVLGSLGNYALWKAGLLGYTADSGPYASTSAIVQWLGFASNLLNLALVVSGIEVIGKRFAKPMMKLIFWLSLLLLCMFGLISGMKSGPIMPLFTVAFVSTLVKRRMPRTALLLPVVLVTLVYPFVTAYRDILNAGYRSQINTVGGLKSALEHSYEGAFRAVSSSSNGSGEDYSSQATGRLSYLASARDVIGLPAPKMLRENEKLWLAPFYPLVPRFIWKDKPVLNKGQRLSMLLGRGRVSSSALTPVADLYSMNGITGVIVGMFIWGACLQLFMNWIGKGPVSEVGLFVYIVMLKPFLNLETDAVALVTETVQLAILTYVMAYVIYGRLPVRPRHASSDYAANVAA